MLNSELGYFGNVIFCDEIRQEANGKYLLIGVYNSEIVFQQLPALTLLRVLVEIEAPTIGQHILNFEWLIDGVSIGGIEGSINQMRRGDEYPVYVSVALPPFQIQLEKRSIIELVAYSPRGRVSVGKIIAREEFTP